MKFIKSEIEYINENIVLSKNNSDYRYNDFVSGKSNVLLIYGYSGSGQLTLGKKLSQNIMQFILKWTRFIIGKKIEKHMIIYI